MMYYPSSLSLPSPRSIRLRPWPEQQQQQSFIISAGFGPDNETKGTEYDIVEAALLVLSLSEKLLSVSLNFKVGDRYACASACASCSIRATPLSSLSPARAMRLWPYISSPYPSLKIPLSPPRCRHRYAFHLPFSSLVPLFPGSLFFSLLRSSHSSFFLSLSVRLMRAHRSLFSPFFLFYSSVKSRGIMERREKRTRARELSFSWTFTRLYRIFIFQLFVGPDVRQQHD